jgi:hypothetical protein
VGVYDYRTVRDKKLSVSLCVFRAPLHGGKAVKAVASGESGGKRFQRQTVI